MNSELAIGLGVTVLILLLIPVHIWWLGLYADILKLDWEVFNDKSLKGLETRRKVTRIVSNILLAISIIMVFAFLVFNAIDLGRLVSFLLSFGFIGLFIRRENNSIDQKAGELEKQEKERGSNTDR